MTREERDWRVALDEDMDVLRRTRDELRVQVHLGATEAKDAWAQLDHVWHQLQARVNRLGEATHTAVDDVEDATRLLLDELKHGYERIKQAL